MIDVIMPQMGESIVEGTLTKWLKKPGERVERDEPLFEISTDKVDTEIPSPVAGTLGEILVPEGTTVGINTVVGRISDGASAPAAPAPAASVAAAAPAPAVSAGRPATRARQQARNLICLNPFGLHAQNHHQLPDHRRGRSHRSPHPGFRPRRHRRAALFPLPGLP